MGRGKKKQQYRKQIARQHKTAQAKSAARGRTEPAGAEAVAPEAADIPWTAERPQPVRRAFGIFKVGRIDFMGKRKWFAVFSGTLLLVSILSIAFQGLNYGIDFTGGNSYTLRFGQPVQEQQVRAVLDQVNVKGAAIRVDKENPKEALVRTPYLDSAAEQGMMDALKAKFGDIQSEAGEAVSPTISGELLKTALIGTLLACLGILIYVAVRFEYRFATAGVLALVHDTLITTGLFSVLRLEVNASFVAAILTIIGYSINDTIVIFDRIRDNLKRRGKESLEDLTNRSINETFVRSVNTSATAFLAITAIYLFGGVTTKDFALALMVGMIIGSYSSICIASPIWLWWRKRDEKTREAQTKGAGGRPKVARA